MCKVSAEQVSGCLLTSSSSSRAQKLVPKTDTPSDLLALDLTEYGEAGAPVRPDAECRTYVRFASGLISAMPLGGRKHRLEKIAKAEQRMRASRDYRP